jgi:hypothetical protein
VTCVNTKTLRFALVAALIMAIAAASFWYHEYESLKVLINAYSPQAKVTRFTAEADKFRNFASAWRDRWNSLMELFMAGGNYPASGVQFPKEFPQAVDSEIVAAK